MNDFHGTMFNMAPWDGQPINSTQTPEVRPVDGNGNLCGTGTVQAMNSNSMDVMFYGSYFLYSGYYNTEVWCTDANGYYGILGVGSIFVDSW